MPCVKVPSGEITNPLLLLAAARSIKPLVISTGMATLGEIEQALSVIAFGVTDTKESPGRETFARAYATPETRDRLAKRVSLLHCTTEYPAPIDEVNLCAMDTLAEAFGLPVGYSDHSLGITVAVAAVARGAQVIEKHFTLDSSLPGPDHAASLQPEALAAMVRAIRETEAALGVGYKGPTASEVRNATVARKSLVATAAIQPGDVFSEANLGIKRPGTGASPMLYWDYLGRTTERGYEPDEVIE